VGQLIPPRRHKSPVALGVATGSLPVGGGWPETGPLLTGVEDGEQKTSTPGIHRARVGLGGGVSVVEGGWPT